MPIDQFANETTVYQNGQDHRYMPTGDAIPDPRPAPGFYTADGKTFLGPLPPSRLLTKAEMDAPGTDPTFKPDQRELRQLIAVKLRTLANDVEGIGSVRPAHAGEIRRAVDRLRDIAGAME